MILFLISCLAVVTSETYNRSVRQDFPPLYREVLSSWNGSSADELILRWGRPNDIVSLEEGKKVFSYESSLQGDICFSRFLVDEKGIIQKSDAFGPGCYHWVEPYFVYPTELPLNNEDYVQ